MNASEVETACRRAREERNRYIALAHERLWAMYAAVNRELAERYERFMGRTIAQERAGR